VPRELSCGGLALGCQLDPIYEIEAFDNARPDVSPFVTAQISRIPVILFRRPLAIQPWYVFGEKPVASEQFRIFNSKPISLL